MCDIDFQHLDLDIMILWFIECVDLYVISFMFDWHVYIFAESTTFWGVIAEEDYHHFNNITKQEVQKLQRLIPS